MSLSRLFRPLRQQVLAETPEPDVLDALVTEVATDPLLAIAEAAARGLNLGLEPEQVAALVTHEDTQVRVTAIQNYRFLTHHPRSELPRLRPRIETRILPELDAPPPAGVERADPFADPTTVAELEERLAHPDERVQIEAYTVWESRLAQPNRQMHGRHAIDAFKARVRQQALAEGVCWTPVHWVTHPNFEQFRDAPLFLLTASAAELEDLLTRIPNHLKRDAWARQIIDFAWNLTPELLLKLREFGASRIAKSQNPALKEVDLDPVIGYFWRHEVLAAIRKSDPSREWDHGNPEQDAVFESLDVIRKLVEKQHRLGVELQHEIARPGLPSDVENSAAHVLALAQNTDPKLLRSFVWPLAEGPVPANAWLPSALARNENTPEDLLAQLVELARGYAPVSQKVELQKALALHSKVIRAETLTRELLASAEPDVFAQIAESMHPDDLVRHMSQVLPAQVGPFLDYLDAHPDAPVTLERDALARMLTTQQAEQRKRALLALPRLGGGTLGAQSFLLSFADEGGLQGVEGLVRAAGEISAPPRRPVRSR